MVSAREAAELQQGLEDLEKNLERSNKTREEDAERYSRIQEALAVRPRSGAPLKWLEELDASKYCSPEMAKPNRVRKQQHETLRARRPRASKAQLSTRKPTRPRLRSIRTTEYRTRSSHTPTEPIERKDVVCNCAHALPDADEVFIVCERCLNLQHPACAVPDDAIGETPAPPRCNSCKKIELHRHMTAQRQKIENLGKMISRMVAEAQDFYPKVLWKHYCNLPKGRSSDAVIAITQTTYKRGAMVPVHSAPQSWIDEILSRLTRMMKDAGEEVVNSIIGPNGLQTSSDLNDLAHWRELAKWLLHHGPYKRRKAELGILAEVLGFEEKGTFWDGGWMDDFLDPLRHSEI